MTKDNHLKIKLFKDFDSIDTPALLNLICIQIYAAVENKTKLLIYTHLNKLSPASQLIIHAFTSLNSPFTFSKRFTPINTSHAHTYTKLFLIIIENLCFLFWMFYKNDFDHSSPANVYILNR